MSDDELFTRLLYLGTVVLLRAETDVWLMPLGKLLDLVTCHRQHTGAESPVRERFIDDIIPNTI